MSELQPQLDAMALVDHHCHALVDGELDGPRLELLLGESGRRPPAGCSAWDTALGLAVRALCAPVLDLPAATPAADYLDRRAELGADEVARRLMSGGAATLLVDTGYRGDELVGLERMADLCGGTVAEIGRLETLAESVVAAGTTPTRFADDLAAVLDAHPGVGWKSIAAYRGGLDLDWRRPGPVEVRTAVGEWLASGTLRLSHPVLERHLAWGAIDTGRPVQFHTGFGDTDADLRTSDPALLGPLIAASADIGTPIMLLHTWPRHREAGYLAGMWPHVYADVGEAIPHVGLRATSILAEVLELAPWHKVLYSSDAFGLPEIYHLGAILHRRALADVLAPLAATGFDPVEQARLADLVGSGNARRVYGLS